MKLYSNQLLNTWKQADGHRFTLKQKIHVAAGFTVLSETRFWPYLLNHLSYRPEIFTQNKTSRSPSKNVNHRTHAKLFFYFKKIKNWFSVNFRTPSWFLDRRHWFSTFLAKLMFFSHQRYIWEPTKLLLWKSLGNEKNGLIQPTATSMLKNDIFDRISKLMWKKVQKWTAPLSRNQRMYNTNATFKMCEIVYLNKLLIKLGKTKLVAKPTFVSAVFTVNFHIAFHTVKNEDFLSQDLLLFVDLVKAFDSDHRGNW